MLIRIVQAIEHLELQLMVSCNKRHFVMLGQIWLVIIWWRRIICVFSFRTYSLPTITDSTTRLSTTGLMYGKPEICANWFDILRYGLACTPGFCDVEEVKLFTRGSCGLAGIEAKVVAISGMDCIRG